MDLTSEATLGFTAPDAECPYLATSASWFAWTVGAWLRRTGRTAPRDVRMGRGSQLHANGMLLAVASSGAVERIR